MVAVWNAIDPWPRAWWGIYFLVVFLIVPICMALITSIWFWIGGLMDMRNLFRDLQNRTTDDLDNGMVVNGVSMSDAARFKDIEEKQTKNKKEICK